MQFKLVYENHQHYGLHVADILLMMKYSLASLGHTADIEHRFMPGYMNIMLECFDDDFVKHIENTWSPGTGLIVVSTEFITGGTFNNIYNEPEGIREKADHNQRKDYWQQRYNNFSRILPYVSAVWHPAKQQVPLYRETFPAVNIEYMPHAYSNAFATVKQYDDSKKDIDVLFTGTLTRYRKEMIAPLHDAGLNVVVSSLFTAPFHREDLISRAKVTLNIKQHSDWEHESVGRLHYHLSNDSILITDDCRFPTDLHEYVSKVGDSWEESIMEQLSLGFYTKRARDARERYSHSQPATILFKHLLEESGIV